MKRPLFALLLAGSSALAASDRIKIFALNDAEVYRITTAPTVTTTVEFPDTIEMINGKGLVSDEAKQAGKFEFGFLPNTNYFSITPLADNVATNLNVAVDGEIYCLEIVTGQAADYKVSFSSSAPLLQTAPVDGGVLPPLSETPTDLDASAKRKVSVARVIGLIDKAKAYPILAIQKDSPVKDLLTAFPQKTFETEMVRLTLRGVYRDNAFDGICFAVEMESKDGKVHHYDVESFGVAAGNRQFGQFTASASGEVPATGTAMGFFAIAGDGTGGRNDLAPTNDFQISLNFTEAKRPEPLLPAPLGSSPAVADEAKTPIDSSAK
jgi:hypothetical protein